MDLLIRDIEPSVVKSFDLKAKELSLSRNEYLKRLLARESNNHNQELVNERKNSDKVLGRVADALDFTHHRLDKVDDYFEKQFVLTSLLTGISLNDIDGLLKQSIDIKERE